MKKILMMITMLGLTTGAYAERGSYDTLAAEFTQAGLSGEKLKDAMQSKLEELFDNSKSEAKASELLGGKLYAMYISDSVQVRIATSDEPGAGFNLSLTANNGYYYDLGLIDSSSYELIGKTANCDTEAELHFKNVQEKGINYIVLKYSADHTLICMEPRSDVDDEYTVLTLKQPEEKE